MLFSSTLLALRALLVLLCLRNVKAQSYTLADAYMPSNFFDMFDFYTVSSAAVLCVTILANRPARREEIRPAGLSSMFSQGSFETQV